MTEQFLTNFSARLATGITSTATTFSLTSVPLNAPVGTYRFKFGNSPFSCEFVAADYIGSGVTFTNAQRAAEGGNPALAWPAGTSIAHVITGLGLASIVITPPVLFEHEEFSPPATANSIGLAHVSSVILTVSRNGIIQSVADGHYTVLGATLTFSTVFSASERVVVAYSHATDQALLAEPIGAQVTTLPPGRRARLRDYSFSHTHQNTA